MSEKQYWKKAMDILDDCWNYEPTDKTAEDLEREVSQALKKTKSLRNLPADVYTPTRILWFAKDSQRRSTIIIETSSNSFRWTINTDINTSRAQPTSTSYIRIRPNSKHGCCNSVIEIKPSIQVSLTPAAQCGAGFAPCDERRLAEQKSPLLTAQTTQPC